MKSELIHSYRVLENSTKEAESNPSINKANTLYKQSTNASLDLIGEFLCSFKNIHSTSDLVEDGQQFAALQERARKAILSIIPSASESQDYLLQRAWDIRTRVIYAKIIGSKQMIETRKKRLTQYLGKIEKIQQETKKDEEGE